MKWQNVMFAEKALLSVLRSATLTEDLTELGSQTLERLEQLLTAQLSQCMFVLVAYAAER